MSQVLGLSKKLKIFQKSENLPKIWKSSKNLKIWKFSENLKIFQNFEKFPKICLIKCLWGHSVLQAWLWWKKCLYDSIWCFCRGCWQHVAWIWMTWTLFGMSLQPMESLNLSASQLSIIEPELLEDAVNSLRDVTLVDTGLSVNQVWKYLLISINYLY